ncbi:MAG: hypothetical protein HKL96_09660 [Phycisphaerales bacterium]|nr:hypothetical protein [Phycisphaerales bacterium]
MAADSKNAPHGAAGRHLHAEFAGGKRGQCDGMTGESTAGRPAVPTRLHNANGQERSQHGGKLVSPAARHLRQTAMMRGSAAMLVAKNTIALRLTLVASLPPLVGVTWLLDRPRLTLRVTLPPKLAELISVAPLLNRPRLKLQLPGVPTLAQAICVTRQRFYSRLALRIKPLANFGTGVYV